MQVTDILSIQLYTLRSLNDLDKVLDAVGTLLATAMSKASARISTMRRQ